MGRLRSGSATPVVDVPLASRGAPRAQGTPAPANRLREVRPWDAVAVPSRAVELYANAFATPPGRCWQMVLDSNPRKFGHPLHCPRRSVVRGIYRSATGEGWWVESCQEHSDALEDVRAKDALGRGRDQAAAQSLGRRTRLWGRR